MGNLHCEVYLHIPLMHTFVFMCLHIYSDTSAAAVDSHHLHTSPPFTAPSINVPLKWRQQAVCLLLLIQNDMCLVRSAGLVPESTVEREAHEAVERSGRSQTRIFPQPAADAYTCRPTGARGANFQRTLLLLWRYVHSSGIACKNIQHVPPHHIFYSLISTFWTLLVDGSELLILLR